MFKNLPVLLFALLSAPSFATGTHADTHGHGAGNGDSHGHDEAQFSVGKPASGKPDRIFEVSMQDTMRFEFQPALKDLHQNEIVRFNISNDGAIAHEFSIGNAEDQVEHARMMREMPGMAHADANTVSLKPGESASITWKFEGDDTVVFSCNVPGHFEAGMGYQLAIGGRGHSDDGMGHDIAAGKPKKAE